MKELERVRWEEQRKTMEGDAQRKAELSQYQDQLARKRATDEHEKYRQRNAELVRMQEEAANRQEQQKQVVAQQIEAERRATEQHKVPLPTHSSPSSPILVHQSLLIRDERIKLQRPPTL